MPETRDFVTGMIGIGNPQFADLVGKEVVGYVGLSVVDCDRYPDSEMQCDGRTIMNFLVIWFAPFTH